MDSKYYHIDEVAKLTELTKRTIRYYEDMELLKPIRTDAGYRLYDEEIISTIKEIKNLRIKLGLTIPEVKNILGLKSRLNNIFEGKVADSDYIEESRELVNTLIKMIVEKEEVLNKVKENCNNYLLKLDSIINRTKEEHCER